MATTQNVNNASVFIPELWGSLVQKATENNLVAANVFMDVSGYGDIKSKGDTLHIPLVSNFTASDKVATSEVVSSANSELDVQLSINKHKAIRVQLEDIAKVQASYDMMGMYTQKIGYGLAKALDADLLSLFSGLSQTVGAASSTDVTAISDTTLVRGIRMLDLADAPQSDRAFIIDPYGIEDLRLIDKFTRYDSIAQDGASRVTSGIGKNGLFGSVYGIPVYVSNNVQTTSVVGGTLSRALLVHKEAFMYAMQKDKEILHFENVPFLTHDITGQSIYGVKEYRDNHGVVYSYAQ